MNLQRIEKRKLIISDGKILFEPTEEEIAFIKDRLTFDNPVYKNALKYSRYSRINAPRYITYYTVSSLNGKRYIQVPLGFDLHDIINPNSVQIIDKRVNVLCNPPEFCLSLRDAQQEAFNSYVYSNPGEINMSSIIQLPTGKGKSILGVYIAYRLKCKTLIVVHKDDLVTGWKNDISLAFNDEVDCGLIKAKSRKIGDFLTIATVQTLNRLTPEELTTLYSSFGLVILDEMHHCPSSSYTTVAKFKSLYKLGLTATPERNDGLDYIMKVYYGDICYKYVSSVEDTDILPVKVIRKNSPVYFNPVYNVNRVGNRKSYILHSLTAPENFVLSDNQVRLSDIPHSERPNITYQSLDKLVVSNVDYLRLVCNDILKEYNEGHSCLVFFTQKDSLDLYYDALVSKVGNSNISKFYGDCKNNTDSLIVAENNRQHITLTTYAKGTEGTNVKQWEVEFLVSSINNEKNTEQAVGRVRRAKPNKINPALVYDYRFPNVYALSSHGNTRDRRYVKLGFLGDSSVKRSVFSRGY